MQYIFTDMVGKYSTRERAKAAILALVALLAAAATLASCARKAPPGAVPAMSALPLSPITAPNGKAEAGNASGAQPPLAMKPAAAGDSAPPQGEAAGSAIVPPPGRPQTPAEPVLPASLVAERAFSLLAPPTALMPEDSLIGSLQDPRSGKDGEAGAYAAARTFLDGLVAGRLSEAVVEPGSLPLVKTLTAPLLAQAPPASWRLGTIRREGAGGDATATARIRLAWPTGPAPSVAPVAAGAESAPKARYRVGEVGLREKDGVWYIESIDAGVEVLETAPGR
jgi:hypothetical protein